MSDVALAQTTIQQVFPQELGSVKARIHKAYLSLRGRNWSYRRVRAVWYGEAGRIDNHEIEALNELKDKQERLKIAGRINSVIAYLREADPDAFGPDIAGLERVLSQAGLPDRPLAEGE